MYIMKSRDNHSLGYNPQDFNRMIEN